MATMQSWTEGIAVTVLFVIIFGFIVVGMNDLYSKDHTIVGLNTSSFEKDFQTYQKGVDEKFKGGEVSFLSAVGLTVSTSWDVTASTLSLIWGFIMGGWINTIVIDYLHLGEIGSRIAFIIQGLLFISLGFILLRILFKQS